MKKVIRKIVSCILSAALVLTGLPVMNFTKAAKAETNDVLYGDVNMDGEIDLNDILMLKRYIAEENPSGFSLVNADVNKDNEADMNDLLMLKKYLAEWDIQLGPDVLTVSFYDGERLIDTLYVEKGEALGETPSVEQTSKSDGIFEGWYTDQDFTETFYSENPVYENTNVYAKYEEVTGIEEALTIDSFSEQDVETNYAIIVKGEGDVRSALTLVAKDGTEAPELNISDNGDGTYTVTAEGGFNAGSSYELTLANGFNFVSDSGEMPETVRTACFTVAKEIVDTLKLNESIVNIADTAEIIYSNVDSNDDGVYDDTVDELGSTISIDSNGSIATVAGADQLGLSEGDVICFYVGTNPDERVYTGEDASAYVGEPATYVKVKEIYENQIIFTALDEEDLVEVYDIPDVFPLQDTPENNQTNIEKLDTDVYEQYGIDTPTLEFAETKISDGDYVAVYADDPTDESSITFGLITEYNAETGAITYEECTSEDITASRSTYVQPAIEGDKLITEEEKEEIVATVQAQIEESGFAEEAAYALAEMSTETDGFKNMENLRYVMFSDESGEPLTDDEIQLMNLGASFELKDGVKLSVELITSGDDLHFNDGIQLAVGIEAEFEVEAEEGKVVIDLNATFIEELSVKPTVNGELTYTTILFIPVPNGVHITANIDVLNYTAYDFDVTAYTVGKEDKSLWDQVKDLATNPTSITTVLGESGLIPAKYADQLTNVSDVFNKIEEIEKKISDAKTKYEETAEEIADLTSDLADLTSVAEALFDEGLCGNLTVEDWKNSAETFSKTNVAQELLHLTDDGISLDGDAGVDNDVNIKSVEELMEKYSEMLEKETDWVTLLDKNICEASAGVYAINFMVKVDFVIRANMSIALGSTLEYETGKRYTFWFKFGLYKPTGGSSTMDLIDESLVFQFYVMGKLEIKMGAKITIGASIGCSDLAYVGIYAEVGPYVKLYGFFVYTYERLRAANTLNSVKKEQKMGALYLETGIYLIVGVEASAIKGKFEVSYDFVDEEFPILTAGSSEYPYAFCYEAQEDEKVVIRDADGNSANGISMVLPDQLRAVYTMLLTTGKTIEKVYEYSDYYISFSNPNFSLDSETGEISVTVPSEDVRYMDCEMRMTFKYGKMAFSDYDIGVSIPLCWTNLSDDELKECYTASVRVGNDQDGYETVWSTRVMKNTAFELPTEDEIKDLIGYNDLKYTSGSYAQAYSTESGIIEDTVYEFDVTYKEYAVTVSGIEGAQSTQTFTAKYGEAFDFSSLVGTGTNDDVNQEYTIFQNVTTDATISVGTNADGTDIIETINLSSPISERMAQALDAGVVSAVANYVDNSVKVTFTFQGLLQHSDISQTLCKGSSADFSTIEDIVAEEGLAITNITPAIGPVQANTIYMVTVGELTGDSYTISFEENGGSSVPDKTKVVGSVIGTLPTPVKTGYSFGGWYTDASCVNLFADRLMPGENLTLYAKWTANTYTVSFHVNGGTSETPQAITVSYDGVYGTLPEVQRVGYGFDGWFTAAEGGTQVTAETGVALLANQTLYAQWHVLKDIPSTVFDFGDAEIVTYSMGQTQNVVYSFDAGVENYQESEFTFKYMRQGNSEYEEGLPVNAGTYNVTISRPADNSYTKFEHTYIAVILIDKADRSDEAFANVDIYNQSSGLNYVEMQLNPETIVDFNTDTNVVFTIGQKSGDVVLTGEGGSTKATAASEPARIINLLPGTEYAVTFSLTGDPNYYDYTYTGYLPTTITTLSHETSELWTDYAEVFTIDEDAMTITIENEEQLAYLAKTVNEGTSYEGYTVSLARDMNMLGKAWTPIGEYGNSPFTGTFEGNGYTIYGLHTSGSDYAGLFGYATGIIKNVTVAESYISGSSCVGAIVGYMNGGQILNCVSDSTVVGTNDVDELAGTGGIAGCVDRTTISACVNNGRVDGVYQTGGIVGAFGNSTIIVNDINNGPVKGTNNHTGGVAGYIIKGYVMNSVNTGSVTGGSCVGGIAGQNEKNGWVLNCYTIGTIKGTGTYVGAVVGRNTKDKGAVHQVYYLKNSATCNGSERNAVGTEKGTLDDDSSKKNVSAASFTSYTSNLSRDADCGNHDLITALNNWVTWYNDNECSAEWVEGEDGYPLPTGDVNTNEGTKQS